MKKILQFSLIIIALGTFVSSCTTEKRLYMPGYNVEWKKSNNSRNKINVVEDVNATTKEQIVGKNNLFPSNTLESIPEENLTASIDNSDILISNKRNIPKSYTKITVDQIQQRSKINDVFFNTDSCDNIILKNGNEISAKVIEIGTNEIKYKKCDNLNGPTISINKSEVFMVKYPNGQKDIITPNNSTSSNNVNDNNQKNTGGKKGGGFGIVSFILSIIGLIIVPTVFGLLSIIFGIIGMVNRKLKGLAIAGLIIGIIDLVLGLILLASVL